MRLCEGTEIIESINFTFGEDLSMIWVLLYRFQYRLGTDEWYKGIEVDFEIQKTHLDCFKGFRTWQKYWFALNWVLVKGRVYEHTFSVLLIQFLIILYMRYEFYFTDSKGYMLRAYVTNFMIYRPLFLCLKGFCTEEGHDRSFCQNNSTFLYFERWTSKMHI